MNNREKKEIKKKFKEVGQKSRYSETELSMISTAFFENDELLMTIRKHFLQGEPTPQQEKFIKSLTPDITRLIHKCLLPEIDPDSPLHQTVDLWVSIDTVNKLPEDSVLDMKARKIVIDYLEQEFNRLQGGTSFAIIKLKDLVYKDTKESNQAFIELKARNTLLTHIDMHLEELRILAIANSKAEDTEKIKMMNSNK